MGKRPTQRLKYRRLVHEALKLDRVREQMKAITAALHELDDYVDRREQKRILGLFGMIDYDPGYDYKRARG